MFKISVMVFMLSQGVPTSAPVWDGKSAGSWPSKERCQVALEHDPEVLAGRASLEEQVRLLGEVSQEEYQTRFECVTVDG